MVGLGVGAITGGALLSWLILPYPRIICLSPLFKSLVILVRVVGGTIGYVVNLLTFRQGLASNSAKLYKYVRFAGSM